MLHIDLPSRTEIEKLAEYRGAPAVSIYLATTPVTQAADAARIELRNLTRVALAQLCEADADKRVARAIEQFTAMIGEDDAFWAMQANSLAIFVTGEGVRTFRLPNKLPNIVEVSDRFHLKPLLRAVTFPHHAYVLAISVGSVRLLEISSELPPQVVPVPGMPASFNEALGRRSHTAKDGPLRGGDSGSEHANLARYARSVDQALRGTLKGEHAPLIVAAAEPMASIFHNVSSYPNTAQQVISGSADETPDHVLAAGARKILDQIHAAEMNRLCDLFAAREQQGRATSDVADAARAATMGAVDTLMVDMDTVIPGLVGDADGAVTFAAEATARNYGVVDEIARRVLLSGGRVVSARRNDLPRNADLAAILRYAPGAARA